MSRNEQRHPKCTNNTSKIQTKSSKKHTLTIAQGDVLLAKNESRGAVSGNLPQSADIGQTSYTSSVAPMAGRVTKAPKPDDSDLERRCRVQSLVKKQSCFIWISQRFARDATLHSMAYPKSKQDHPLTEVGDT